EALARHEILINLSELLDISRYLLKPGGKLSLIYPAERSAELVFNMCKRRIEPKRLCFVHPDHARQARLVLIEGVKDAGSETRIEPPVFMNQ
ncbi:MAG: SAM-dependent methyltransferase, partial [Thermodesulfobacteria bacterium]|nr:SAM-dependent methyltransferase [Thermodesulfobacteriota bacterium]